MKEPPLGVMPRTLWDGSRRKDLAQAMRRFLDAGYAIPPEWITEYNELLRREGD